MNYINNTNDAIYFLRNHQPMPNSFVCDDDLWMNYLDSLSLAAEGDSIEVIPLILNSYGGGVVPDMIWGLPWEFPINTMIPYFINAISSHNNDTREFALSCLQSVNMDQDIFKNQSLVNEIILRLCDPYSEVRALAVEILSELERVGIYDSSKDKNYIQSCYINEPDKNVKSVYEDVNTTLEAVNELWLFRNRRDT